MCGIVAYIGAKNALPVLIKGLRRLEYRGYDSSGVALIEEGLRVFKKQGKVKAMQIQSKDKSKQNQSKAK